MIVVDTSALMAILQAEPSASACMQALLTENIAISAGTMAESLIVAGQRGLTDSMALLIRNLAMEIVPVDGRFAEQVANAYARWGKGNHPAGLNYGDCFAYTLAHLHAWPLLYVGRDFAKTDIIDAIRPTQ